METLLYLGCYYRIVLTMQYATEWWFQPD